MRLFPFLCTPFLTLALLAPAQADTLPPLDTLLEELDLAAAALRPKPPKTHQDVYVWKLVQSSSDAIAQGGQTCASREGVDGDCFAQTLAKDILAQDDPTDQQLEKLIGTGWGTKPKETRERLSTMMKSVSPGDAQALLNGILIGLLEENNKNEDAEAHLVKALAAVKG